jgi:hypothetical protein
MKGQAFSTRKYRCASAAGNPQSTLHMRATWNLLAGTRSPTAHSSQSPAPAQQRTHVLLQTFRWLQPRDTPFRHGTGIFSRKEGFPQGKLERRACRSHHPASWSKSGTPSHEYFLVKENIIPSTNRKKLAGMICYKPVLEISPGDTKLDC